MPHVGPQVLELLKQPGGILAELRALHRPPAAAAITPTAPFQLPG